MATDQFECMSKVYWDALGRTGLDVFLDEKPPERGAFRWHAIRKMYIVYIFLFYPFVMTLQIWGIVTAESNSLMQISFDISSVGYNLQYLCKMVIWLARIKTVRSLCLDFSKFHVNNFRPKLSSWILERESNIARNLTGRSYWISYANILFWIVLPTSTAVISYLVYLAGYAEPQANYIPRYSQIRPTVDMSLLRNRIFVASLELILFTLGFLSFQAIDMFFAATIQMAQAQYHVLNSALFALDGELQEFLGTEVPVTDSIQPMSIWLIVEDHQQLIRYGVRLRKFLSPILGLATVNCITMICNMTIVATSQLSAEGPFLDLALASFSSILVVLTCLVVFYTFTSMTGLLKDAEESVFHAIYASKWYEKDVRHRKTIIFMQKQAMTPRRIKMFGLGDMGRSTFIDGLRTVYTYYNFMQRFK